MALRTAAEQFDAVFLQRGDPWGYDSSYVRDRLDASLAFIARYVAPNFDGSFLELGAFNGQFTELLAQKFPLSTVIASDVSNVALKMARMRVAKFGNVYLHQADIASYEMPLETRLPLRLLLLECIYYLPKIERMPAIARIVALTQRPEIFLSGPITGGRYLREGELFRKFKAIGYWPRDAMILNLRGYRRPHRFLSRFAFARPAVAKQVIYLFAPR